MADITAYTGAPYGGEVMDASRPTEAVSPEQLAKLLKHWGAGSVAQLEAGGRYPIYTETYLALCELQRMRSAPEPAATLSASDLDSLWSALEYTLATIGRGGWASRPLVTDSDWVAIHKGRASSAEQQLSRWRERVDELRKSLKQPETKADDYAPVTSLTDYPRNGREQP